MEAAIGLAGDRALGILEGLHGSPPRGHAGFFLDLWRAVLVRSNLRAGCAVLAVTVATDSPELLDRAASIFRAWRGGIAQLFVEEGWPRPRPPGSPRPPSRRPKARWSSVARSGLEPFELVAAELLAVTP